MTQPDIEARPQARFYTPLEWPGADDELLAIIGRMNDALTDKELLRMLDKHDRAGNVFRQPR